MQCKHCKDFAVHGVCDDCHENGLIKVLEESDKRVIDLTVDLRVANVELAFVWTKLKEVCPEAYAKANEEVKSVREKEKNRVIEPAPRKEEDFEEFT